MTRAITEARGASGTPPGKPASTGGGDDLAAREYLAMREEMADSVRLVLNLVLSALAVMGAAVAAVVSNVADVTNLGAGGLLLEVSATFGLLVFATAIGIANSWRVLEEYVTLLGQDMAASINGSSGRPPFSFQSRIRRFTRLTTTFSCTSPRLSC